MITSETWYQQLINLMDCDFPMIGALFCLSVIIVGQFFLLNLILAVIIQAFMKSHEEQLEHEIHKLEQAKEGQEGKIFIMIIYRRRGGERRRIRR